MPALRVLAAQKKSANHGAHASGLPQKSRNEFCGIISGLPQKSRSEFCGIISGLPQKSRSEFCGKRRRRRKRKQLEQTQAVSKCALRRRGGDNRTPPKPLKGSHTSASLVRCQRHRASELRVLLVFLPKLLCFAASGRSYKRTSLAFNPRANRQPIAASR